MKKKLTLIIVAVVLVAALAVGGTLAYFTGSDQATNTFTVGNVKIDLTEPTWLYEVDGKPAGGKIDGETVYAGEPLEKDPIVTNTGANPCFVRIKVTGLDQFVTPGMKQALEDATTEEAAEAAMNVILANMIKYRSSQDGNYTYGRLGEGWELHSDGYFYYKAPLQPTDLTSALFSHIIMPTTLENGDGTDCNVTVIAQAVQAQGAKPSWSAVQNMTLEELAAWFDTCGMNPTP